MSQEAVKSVFERRNAPLQKRAQQMVEKILHTTKEILQTEGLDYLTTHSVAEKGGIAVGTIYRYFPNKQALLCAIYEDLLTYVIKTFDKFDSEEHLSLPKEEFFTQLIIELKSAELHDHIIAEIIKAISIFPELQELDDEHADKFAERLASLLKHFGSKWPIDKLQRLTRFVYCIDAGTWAYRRTLSVDSEETLQMELTAVNSLLMSCFD